MHRPSHRRAVCATDFGGSRYRDTVSEVHECNCQPHPPSLLNCALEPDCMANTDTLADGLCPPPGLDYRNGLARREQCHFYDRSVINLLLANYNQFQCDQFVLKL
jgi:hypothetical protein